MKAKSYRQVNRTAWSPSEIRFLEKNADRGASFISRQLKRSLGAVYQKAHHLGMPLGKDNNAST
jgi:hypothetical protein